MNAPTDAGCLFTGVLSNNKRSDETSPAEFDHINSINYRGCWLSSRAAIKQMLTQEPLSTHDGRPGSRGSVVNIASQLGIVGRPAARKSSPTTASPFLYRQQSAIYK
jgi:NAD(P)-dependent dehydrogenase (short-subunit alcohol dehydrogenase family)